MRSTRHFLIFTRETVPYNTETMTSRTLRQLLSRTFVAFLLFALTTTCRVVDSDDPLPNDPLPSDPTGPVVAQSVILQVEEWITGDLRIASRAEIRDKAIEAVVTIHTEAGQATDYNLKRVKVNLEKGVYQTEAIDLPMGKYQITTFYVLTEDNKVSGVTPLKNSPLGNQSNKALPVPFTVSAQSPGTDEGGKVMKIVLPTITTEGKKPQDFGLHSFQFDMKEALQVFIGMLGNPEMLDFKSGRLFITGDGYEHNQNLVAGINQTPLLPLLSTYDVKVQSQGFNDFTASFSLDSLSAYTSSPLLIEMETETIECVGGDYPWDVLLESQTDVDKFGLRCHTQISGSLIVSNVSKDDPIMDLTPLSTLTTVGNSLEISENQQLESLEGLQNLTRVYGQLTIKGNERLKTVEGLRGLRNIQSKLEISDNPALTQLKGLEGLSTVSILFIHDNHKLQSLSGLDQLTKVSHISIANNDRLNSFQGLHHLKEIGRLTITGNSSLTSLRGFGEGVESVDNLEINYTSGLRDLTGMLSPRGKIESSLELFGTGLTSLKGLSFSSELSFGIHIEDNFLTDISALQSVEKIGRSLIIANNSQLRSLVGLNNLISVGDGNNKDMGYRVGIYDNWSLRDFCALTGLFTKGTYYKVTIETNHYNPTVEDIKESQCKL